MITKEHTLAQIVKEYPQTIPYFNDLHFDYCCGGGIPLAEAVKDTDLNVDTVVKEVNLLPSMRISRRWKSIPSIALSNSPLPLC